ncbi:MAG TPA: hypothetical protein VNA24_00525, partial [Hyalangium sp.]|nr:hypothetical protein [Hyalangium sp.]
STPSETGSSTDGEEIRELHWVLGGSRLMANGKWLLDPTTGRFTALPYSTVESVEGGGTLLLQTALSPAGESIAVSDGKTLRRGPVEGPLEEPQALPALLPSAPDSPGQSIRSTLFWLSERLLGLYQVDLSAGEGPRCAVLSSGAQQWGALADCPPGSFFQLWSAESGLQGWLMLTSGAEGEAAMNLVRHVPDRKPAFEEELSFPLGPDGEVHAQFAQDLVRLYLTTPCALEREQPPPCENMDRDSKWRLYAWEGPGSRLTLKRQDLPTGAVPHSSGNRWAWPEQQRVCVGDTFGEVACFSPPQ